MGFRTKITDVHLHPVFIKAKHSFQNVIEFDNSMVSNSACTNKRMKTNLMKTHFQHADLKCAGRIDFRSRHFANSSHLCFVSRAW